MPDPHALKVGDLVKFIGLPDEWGRSGYVVQRESVAFMRAMIRRRYPSRVFKIDEDGTPWIKARFRQKGKVHHHSWGILESSGWRLVRRRRRRRITA